MKARGSRRPQDGDDVGGPLQERLQAVRGHRVLNDLDLEIPGTGPSSPSLGAGGAGNGARWCAALNFLEPINGRKHHPATSRCCTGRLYAVPAVPARKEVAASGAESQWCSNGSTCSQPHDNILQNLIEAPVGVLKSPRDEGGGRKGADPAVADRFGRPKEAAYPDQPCRADNASASPSRGSLMMDPSIMPSTSRPRPSTRC